MSALLAANSPGSLGRAGCFGPGSLGRAGVNVLTLLWKELLHPFIHNTQTIQSMQQLLLATDATPSYHTVKLQKQLKMSLI